MAKKKKKVKRVVRPIKMRGRTVEFWGMLSCTIGIVYMAYFLYLAFVFHVTPSVNFVYILYALSIFPLGIVGFSTGVLALKSADNLGFGGIVCSVVGAAAYVLIWYEVAVSTPQTAAR